MCGPGPKWQEKHRASFRLAASAQPKDEAERELLAQSAQAMQPQNNTKQALPFSLCDRCRAARRRGRRRPGLAAIPARF